jgi:hypothetical protein
LPPSFAQPSSHRSCAGVHHTASVPRSRRRPLATASFHGPGAPVPHAWHDHATDLRCQDPRACIHTQAAGQDRALAVVLLHPSLAGAEPLAIASTRPQPCRVPTCACMPSATHCSALALPWPCPNPVMPRCCIHKHVRHTHTHTLGTPTLSHTHTHQLPPHTHAHTQRVHTGCALRLTPGPPAS